MIGLLCAADGRPLSIEVFPGNTRDPATFAARVDKVAERFSVDHITFVGDRGMTGSRQIDGLAEHGFHFHRNAHISSPPSPGRRSRP